MEILNFNGFCLMFALATCTPRFVCMWSNKMFFYLFKLDVDLEVPGLTERRRIMKLKFDQGTLCICEGIGRI
jgi:hypothetical protein